MNVLGCFVYTDWCIMPCDYQVMVNAGEEDEISVSLAEIIRSHTVSNLTPYTRYSVRIGACLQGVINSCATGTYTFIPVFIFGQIHEFALMACCIVCYGCAVCCPKSGGLNIQLIL